MASLGVLAFSFTFPATTFALRGFDPYLIGIGRAAVAAILAATVLGLRRAPRPRGGEWGAFVTVTGGVVFGFPVLSTLALRHGSSASHAAVVVGLLPAATAVAAILRAGERPSRLFWVASLAGTACVVGFTLRNGPGRFSAADLLLFGALLAAAVGYAEGGRLARTMSGADVVSWALVIAAPVTVPLTAVLWIERTPRLSGAPVAGMAYLACVSMFLGFFAWYAGLAKGGVARAGQVQLAQPLLTIIWSRLLLEEHAGMSTVVAAVGVLACVLLAQRARVTGSVAAVRGVPGAAPTGHRTGTRDPASVTARHEPDL
jgi:drug/metabolite transporter (DMT)-like permease